MRWVSSDEFSDWIAFWTYEAELRGAHDDDPPDAEGLRAKIHGWAARHNASVAAREQRGG